MTEVEYQVFTPGHIVGAAQVLADRHARLLKSGSPLARKIDFVEQIRTASQESSGAVAICNNEVVGYLLGKTQSDDIGPHVWSHLAGHAAEAPELIDGLYCFAAKHWVEQGLTRHFVFSPANPEYVDPWFRLGFGLSAVMAAHPVAVANDWKIPKVIIRRVETADYPHVARLERELFLSLRESPSFSKIDVESLEEFTQSWMSMESDDRYVAWCCEVDGQIVGELFLYRRPEGDLRVPSRSIDLSSASVDPAFRRRGIARALTQVALEWAKENEIDTLITDWRATNLIAAHTWPKLGFEPTFFRLYRSIP